MAPVGGKNVVIAVKGTVKRRTSPFGREHFKLAPLLALIPAFLDIHGSDGFLKAQNLVKSRATRIEETEGSP